MPQRTAPKAAKKGPGRTVRRAYKAEDDAPRQIRQGGTTYTLKNYANGKATYRAAAPGMRQR